MYKVPIYCVVGSSSENDSKWSGSVRRGVGSVRIPKGFGGVGTAYGFSRNPISPANVPSVNVPFSMMTI